MQRGSAVNACVQPALRYAHRGEIQSRVVPTRTCPHTVRAGLGVRWQHGDGGIKPLQQLPQHLREGQQEGGALHSVNVNVNELRLGFSEWEDTGVNADVHVNEPRLGFSNTTRNPEGILMRRSRGRGLHKEHENKVGREMGTDRGHEPLRIPLPRAQSRSWRLPWRPGRNLHCRWGQQGRDRTQ